MKLSLDYFDNVWSLTFRKEKNKNKNKTKKKRNSYNRRKWSSKNIKVILLLAELSENDLILDFSVKLFINPQTLDVPKLVVITRKEGS